MSYQNLFQSPAQQQPTYFCYLYIKLMQTAILSFLNLIFASVILGIAVRQYRKTNNINMISFNLRLIYIAIFAELGAFIIKIILSQVVYWIPVNTNQFYSHVSKYIYVIDIIGVFAIQSMLIMVCYNWMDKIVDIFQELSNLQDTTQSKKNRTNKFINFQKWSKFFLKFYLRIRFLFFGLLIAFISVRAEFIQTILLKITLVLLLAQATFVPIILGLGVFAIKRNVKMTELVGEKQTYGMIKQFSILIICTVLRLVIDVIFVTFTFIRLNNNRKCIIQEDVSIWIRISGISQLLVESLITHFLPIYIVLKLFKISQKNVDLSQSLLAAQNYMSTTEENN